MNTTPHHLDDWALLIVATLSLGPVLVVLFFEFRQATRAAASRTPPTPLRADH